MVLLDALHRRLAVADRIAAAAVQHPVMPTGGARGQLAPLHQGDPEAAQGKIVGQRPAGTPAADDQYVGVVSMGFDGQVSSGSMVIAPHGHSSAQMPHPLQELDTAGPVRGRGFSDGSRRPASWCSTDRDRGHSRSRRRPRSAATRADTPEIRANHRVGLRLRRDGAGSPSKQDVEQRAIEPEETHARSNRRQVDLRLRRGLARHARAAGRQGRRHRRDDARARPRPRPRRLHHHHRGVRGVHARRPARPPTGWRTRSTRRSRAWRSAPASASAIRDDPLLVSVRSGARDSMPGMMDTVLNLGLNDASVEGLAARTGNPRFAWDSYRRLVQMFGDVVRGVPGARFEDEIARIKRERGVTLDTELDADALRELTARFQALYDFPTGPARAARAGHPRGLRLVDGRARRSPTGASTASPTTGAPRSTSSRWSTATRARPRAPAWPSRATRSPARPSPAATS